MSNMQALIDGLSAQWQRERAESQMTLGKLIAALEAMPPDAEVDGIKFPHSYRGYYSDLAFEPNSTRIRAADALAMCKKCMGQVFVGWKGGDFVMGSLTPLWVASEGCCGQKIMALHANGGIELASDEDD